MPTPEGLERSNSPRQAQSERDRVLDAMENRLSVLLRKGGRDPSDPSAPLTYIMERHGMNPVNRVKFLLFTASAVCALRAGRIDSDRFKELYRGELKNAGADAPASRLIQRHVWTAYRLVIRGCEKRGEIPTEGGSHAQA